MMRMYRRGPVDRREGLAALVAGLAVGAAAAAVTWYLARAWLSRERVDAPPRPAAARAPEDGPET